MADEKPNVLVARKFPPSVEERLARDYAALLNRDDTIYTAERLLALAEGMDALMIAPSERLTAEVIGRLPASVKIAVTFSVGYEHIDVAAAKARGLMVTNTPDVLTDATADLAMLCLLGAARRAAEGEAMIRNDRWQSWHATMLLGVHVSGKRLGILGMGRIGRALAQRARGFEMEVHYHNRSRLEPALERGAVYHALAEQLLAQSQFLSINAPSSTETRNFLNAERIALMPDRAVVINTARGDLVDDRALIAALKSGKLAAAGLDVYAGEPNIHPDYRALANTFLLPHLGSATVETRDAMGFCCLDNLDAYFAGKPCPTPLY